MSAESLVRIGAIFRRYFILYRRSLIRTFDIAFWPVMDLLIWGFVSVYLEREIAGAPGAGIVLFLIGALIGWDVHYRGQQALTISLMEEIWTKNIVNLLIAPIRLWEWIAASALYAALKVLAVTLILGVLAKLLYAFDLMRLGWTIIPLWASLLVFGWAIGLMTAGLLLRYGYAAEALIWGIPFLLQPFTCVFYPVDALPVWAQWIAKLLPTSYTFEALRMVLLGRTPGAALWWTILGLNAFYLAAGTSVLLYCFHLGRKHGRLARLGQD